MKLKFDCLADKFLYLFIAACCGCGGDSPDLKAPNQPVATENASPQSTPSTGSTNLAAEVNESFSGFETGIKEQAVSNASSTPAAKSPPAVQTAGPAPAAPATPALQSVPVPTAEQLKRWAVNPYEPLQLLECRDSGQAGSVTSAAVIGEGSSYALAGNRLTAWSLAQSESTHDFSDPANEQVVKAFAAAPDGKWVVAGDSKGNLQVFDLPDYKQRIAKTIYPSGVARLAISPDSKSVATASFTGEVTIWDAAKWTVRNKFTVAKQALQALLYVTPTQLAVAAQDAGIWNVETGNLEHLLTQGGYHATFAMSPAGKQLAFGSDGKLELWNVADSKVDAAIVGGFSNNDLAAFSPDGKYLVTSSKFMIQVWEAATGQLVQVIDAFGWETIALHWLPKPSLLLIASENGRVRFWGSTATATTLGWKPLHGPLPTPKLDPNSDANEPASPAQLMQVIDIRTLPKLPGAMITAINDSLIFYSTPAKIDEAKVFYHHLLTSRGWSQTTETNSPPDAMNFTKQGFSLSLYFSQNPDGATQVSLSTAGDVDLRRLPKFEEKPTVLYDAASSVQYRVKAPLLDIETTLIRKFYDAGWTAYARLNSSKNEEVDRRSLTFVRGATTLQVTVQPQPTEFDAYAISYNKFLTTKSLPIPRDSGFIEFDGSTQPLMVASTAMTLAQTRDFYDKQMAADGWLRRDSGKMFKDKTGRMDFIRNQCDVSIVLETLDSGRTQIRVGENLQNSSWQVAKATATEGGVASKKGESSGVEAADFPALHGWTITKYDPEQKQIDLIAKEATTLAVAEAYTKALASLGWKTDGRGIKSDDYLLAEFTKDKGELTLRATLRGGEVQASFSGDGLLWSKPLPVAKQIIAYETWLRINRFPASLELLGKYVAEMKAIVQK